MRLEPNRKRAKSKIEKLADINYRKRTVLNYFMAGLLVLIISFFLILNRPVMHHWFVLPAIACGILLGVDFVRWIRMELDPFDPKGLIGLLLFHGWFLAPLLHVYWNLVGSDLYLPTDFRPWLGIATLINFIGIICFKLSQRWFFRRTVPVSAYWKLILVRFIPFLVIAIVLGLFAQALFYQKYFAAMRLINRESAHLALKGTGWLLMLGDSLPLLVALAVIIPTPNFRRRRTWVIAGLVLLGIAATQFVWSGLRGSRSAFVGIMFFSTCLVHFWWRRLKAIHLMLALALLMPFMYFYGFYKAGEDPLKAIGSQKERQHLEKKTRRTFPGMVLGDMARADVQARICQVLATGENDYQLRWGRTYLEALAKPIPYSVWDLILGNHTFRNSWSKRFAFYELNKGRVEKPDYYPSASRVYAISGEAMLNFGFLGVVPAWFFFGSLLGWFRAKLASLPDHDARRLMVPMFIGVCLFFPISDLSNIVMMAFKQGLVLILIVLLCSRRYSPSLASSST